MLVLSRKVFEEIRIGDNITISVLRIDGNRVRVGINAPRDVRVLRDELAPRDESGAASSNADAAAEPTSGERAENPPADEGAPVSEILASAMQRLAASRGGGRGPLARRVDALKASRNEAVRASA